MVRMLLLAVVCIGVLPIQMRAQKNSYIIPGEVWKDTDGNPINAHGGGLLYHDGTLTNTRNLINRKNRS